MSNASSTAPGNTVGSLFTGLKFFLVHKLPARTQLIADIEANGGSVVRLEKQADFVIADHARRDAPTGSYSWKLISTAIEDGAMPDPADYPAGPPPGTVRDIASGVPGKSKRTAFTLEDDKELWQWVQEQAPGGYGVKGNEIYRRLEQRNPRHTMQAWRDRYMKKLMDHPPAGINLTVPARPPPSPPTALDEQGSTHGIRTPPVKRRRVEASTEQAVGVGDDPDAQSANGESEASNEELASNTTPERYATKDHSAANFSVVQVKANESGQVDSDISTSDANQAATRQIMSLLPIESIEYHASRTQDTPATATESSKNSEEDEAAELESWMATMKVRGHDDNLVIEALKCTSMNLGLAELVLMHVKGGKGIPDDVPGVWTHEEDEQVEGGNARALRVLETKHGWPACTARLRFLERYRNED
ncbi:Myb_DNA-bind_2-domain-containing protein [Sphaerulina musiva SO2202]|uniref:DNA-binding protein RAP1 n=1 Tax=Sphaerulina musiva (strain SO2202) TaxID=692275 RepID=N1QGL8_SPHMS|nr:Myb_DNA-bind_2-domain-containing protein [Sphaerulina musiva SO2202]EMF16315.1 Myb_DNA-bind_2-domain-containing protein [Sphaerulina musiva SO2202]